MTTSDDGPAPVESGILAKANRLLRASTRSDGNILPLRNKPYDPSRQPIEGGSRDVANPGHPPVPDTTHPTNDVGTSASSANEKTEAHNGARNADDDGRVMSSQAEEGSHVGSGDGGGSVKQKPNIAVRFYRTVRAILLHSWVNVLLVFVPVGIVLKAVPGIHVGVVFAINCIAIIPLAGLLSHATESVASKLGDTIGALLNVTFGNAVELIIL